MARRTTKAKPRVRLGSDVRQRQVLEVAAELFHARGYTGTSMDDIAEAAGVSKGTLYHHFGGKAEILKTVYEESVDFVLDRIAQHPADAPPAETIRLLIGDTLALVRERRHHVTVFYQEMRWLRQWLPSSSARSLERKMRRYRDYIRGVIRKGVESGDFRDDVDESLAAFALMGMASWTYQWFEPDGRVPAEELAERFAEIFIDGVRAS